MKSEHIDNMEKFDSADLGPAIKPGVNKISGMGHLIREYLNEKGKDKMKLAEDVGIEPTRLENVLNDNTDIYVVEWTGIARWLGVHPLYFVYHGDQSLQSQILDRK